MATLFHLIFEVLKIALLGFIYSKILIVIYNKFVENKSGILYQKIIEPKRRLWFYISLLLFLFMMTNIGSHGLGDSANIPISFSKSISNIDWTEYGILEKVNTEDGKTIETKKWKVENGKLCGDLSSDFNSFKNSYFIYDISTEVTKEFNSEVEYNKFAISESLPNSSELKSFEENYSDYWRGWRFWLLP